MKTWNVPAMEELNVELTANGIFDSHVEVFLVHNDSLNSGSTDGDKNDKNDADKNS